VIPPGDPIPGGRAAERSCKIRHLPVVGADGLLVGIVTDRDIRQIAFSPAVRARLGDVADLADRVTVDEIMTAPVVTVSRFDDLAEAARIMSERKIGALPVVLQGRVVGILTELDVLRAFAEMAGRPHAAAPEDW
jgi:acetoin utilization protein AcuB